LCKRLVGARWRLVVRVGYRGGGRRRRSSRANRQVLGDGEVVVRTVKYSEIGVSCRAGRQVLVNRTPLA
jgi:hypothetical protein